MRPLRSVEELGETVAENKVVSSKKGAPLGFPCTFKEAASSLFKINVYKQYEQNTDSSGSSFDTVCAVTSQLMPSHNSRGRGRVCAFATYIRLYAQMCIDMGL